MALGILNNIEDKSFLSFTFDGKAIEDFGFAVVYNGDRLSNAFHPTFTNTTTTVPGRLGSIYWGTEVTGYTFDIQIATDRATARQIANLKRHFAPGKYAELSLAESEYCYCYAMVNSNSTFSFVPFEEKTIIKGKEYVDTIYKGDATLSFFVPQIYFYGKATYGPYVSNPESKPWFLASGLLISKDSIPQKNCFLANGYKEGNPGTSGTIYAYNAGNAPARVNIEFDYKPSDISGSGGKGGSDAYNLPWTDIKIGNIIITKPRLFRDVENALKIIWEDPSNGWPTREQDIATLRESLDSCYREQLIGIFNRITSGADVWGTRDYAETIAKSLIEGKTFHFSIDAMENQAMVTASGIPHYDFITGPVDRNDYTTVNIVENIGDSINGEYLILDGSDGLKSDGTVDVQEIKISGGTISNLKLYFVNTYFV